MELCFSTRFLLVMAGAGEYHDSMRASSLFTAFACLALASCAGTKNFTIYTTPCDGATVHINGKRVPGTTPVVTEIEQDKDLGIVVEKEGYRVGSVTIHTQTSWWRSLLWTENDPNARFIEEDEVTIPMQRIEQVNSYKPTVLPAFEPPPAAIQAAPSLGPAPTLSPLPPSLRR